jgi:hypothetical protein
VPGDKVYGDTNTKKGDVHINATQVMETEVFGEWGECSRWDDELVLTDEHLAQE